VCLELWGRSTNKKLELMIVNHDYNRDIQKLTKQRDLDFFEHLFNATPL
jgi:hypothetical protein